MELSKTSSNNRATPCFSFKDLDENKPSGSIRICVETIDYFLRRYREDIIKRRKLEGDIEAQLAALEESFRSQPRDQYEVAIAADQAWRTLPGRLPHKRPHTRLTEARSPVL
jgi:hypothetical protein